MVWIWRIDTGNMSAADTYAKLRKDAKTAYLANHDLSIFDRAALDRLGSGLYRSFHKDDAFRRHRLCPFDHMFGDVLRLLREQSLDCVSTLLSELEEAHLASLRSRVLDSCSELDGLACSGSCDVGDLFSFDACHIDERYQTRSMPAVVRAVPYRVSPVTDVMVAVHNSE